MFFKRSKNKFKKILNINLFIFSFFVVFNIVNAEILPGDVMPFADEEKTETTFLIKEATNLFEDDVLPFFDEVDVSPFGYYFGVKDGDVAPFQEEKEYKLLKYGYGTFYGTTDIFHGKQTASGEIFDRNLMTCAMNGIKFGTNLKVTNIANNQYIIVKVNDRMGTYHGNSIDLSVKAFEKIAKLSTGKIWVKIE